MDGVSTSEYCDGAHGPYRCTSGTDTVALLGSRFTESHHAYIWSHNLKCAGGQTSDDDEILRSHSRTSGCRAYYFWLIRPAWHHYKPMLVASMSDVAAVATQDNEQKQRRTHGKICAL